MGDGSKIIVHNITKDLKIFMLVTGHKIIIHHEKISLTYFYSATKSQMKTSLEQFWSKHELLSTMVTNKTSLIKWISLKRSRFNLTWTIKRLCCDIFTIKIVYSNMIRFKDSNIDIHQVLTFFKILNIFISTIFASLLNSKCLLGELEK